MDEEQADKTRHPKIFIGHTREQEWEALGEQLVGLVELARAGGEDLRAALQRIIPEYRPPDLGENPEAPAGFEYSWTSGTSSCR